MANFRKIADKQDQRVSKCTGWAIECNSGATKGRKGDLKGYNILVETKTKAVKSEGISISEVWFDKLHSQAFSMGKELNVIVFSFGDGKDYAAMSLRIWNKIFDMRRFGSGVSKLTVESSGKSKKTVTITDKHFEDLAILKLEQNTHKSILCFYYNPPIQYVAMDLDQFIETYNEYLHNTKNLGGL